MGEILLICYECGSKNVNRIDSGWAGEVERPYGIYMCISCEHLFIKYDDEVPSW